MAKRLKIFVLLLVLLIQMDYFYRVNDTIMVQVQKFGTLIQLMQYFKTEQICRDYLELSRWNGGEAVCPYKDCEGGKVCKYSDGKRFKCGKCNRQFSVRVGTIFEDSKISLQKWYAAIYLITSHKKGISSCQLARDLGVTQKTAWYMNHRVRTSLGLSTGNEKLSGVVEADETFIGGLEANKHKSKRVEGAQGRSVQTKSAVAGVVERGGNVKAKLVPNTNAANLQRFIYENVATHSTLHTDEWYGYNGLHKLYEHTVVKHNDKQYVDGDCHTNTLEGYWSLVKRGCIGIYHSWSAKHLQKYLDEFSFRYNTRKLNENERFNVMLNNISTTLSYKQLISNGEERKPFYPAPIVQSVEVKQGTFGF